MTKAVTEHHYTCEFDPLFNQVPIYKRFPMLMPSVGSCYGESGPKLLIIGESHYFPKRSTVHLNADAWYLKNQTHLGVIGKDNECDWINTRGILRKKRGYWKRGHTIYRNLENALHQAGIPVDPNVFQHVAFMNAFQRPAETGMSIRATESDRRVAVDTVSRVIEIIKPDLIVIVSSKVRDQVGKQLARNYKSTPHPACAHWNNPNQRLGSGRAQFIGHIQEIYARRSATN